MRIGLISSGVPLINGGGRFIVDWARQKLQEHGHQVAVVILPTTDETDHILQQMAAFRMMRLDHHFDRVVTFRPPSHMVEHPHKIVWFIHHIRVFYDLWDSPYRGMPDLAPYRALRAQVMQADTAALQSAARVFTNSRVVGDRLRRFNGIDSEVLYPPVLAPEMFTEGTRGDEIVCVCRVEHHKRQHLLVEAMAHVKSRVRLRLCGLGSGGDYMRTLQNIVAQHDLGSRVVIENAWITEADKALRLSQCLAAAYVPLDEDSYGYPTIEAAHAKRCTLTLTDSGGTAEFIEDGVSGIIAEPHALAIADAFDRLYNDPARTRRMGEAAFERVTSLGISWDHVIARLIA
jgi:glycosyltransferase involved in cell wall biosynthesis